MKRRVKVSNVRIVNRSVWPDWYCRALVEFACKRAGVDWPYVFTFRHTNRDTWRGRGWTHQGNAVCHRRVSFFKVRDHRFKWGGDLPYLPKSPCQQLAYLVFHEVRHATPANKAAFRRAVKGGTIPRGERRNVASGEYDANTWGAEALREWVEGGGCAEAVKAERARRARKRNDRARVAVREAGLPPLPFRRNRSAAERARAMVDELTRESKRLNNRLAKWKRRARALDTAFARMERKAAEVSQRPGEVSDGR